MSYMVVRGGTDVRKVHLSEISTLIIENTAVSLTAALLCELAKRKINVIFCDERHNPYGELEPFYGSHDSPSKLRNQIKWEEDAKRNVWTEIVKEKIWQQSELLLRLDYDRSMMLKEFMNQVQSGDASNREGHAAKVYFNTLFGMGFSRRDECPTNALLNYGYAILLSAVNREVVALGYTTQIGMFHDNTFNHFNLSSDIMEPLRPIVDSIVLDLPQEFNTDNKRTMAGLMNVIVKMEGKDQYLNNAIRIYVKSVTDAIESGDTSLLKFCNHERTCDEVDSVL